MRPKLELLTGMQIGQIFDEAFQLLLKPGVKVQYPEARQLLAEAGANVDETTDVVRIPEKLVRAALQTVPTQFFLHDRRGNPAVQYGGEAVHFDPGSSAVHILDPDTGEHHPSETKDLARLVKVAEMLPQYDAQSTAVVCNEVAKEIGDLYRLYVVLMLSEKPIVTGAFSNKNLQAMFDMLAIYAGGRDALAAKPMAVFDVCPSPPLIWSAFGAGNLIQLARAGVPAEIISMPLAGAGSPVTLLGSLVQHTAECLSGIAIHQLARPGAPIVWGGAPAIFDMKKGGTPMGAIETAMLDAGYAQVGKSLGMPTHGYLCATDAKLVDAQAGLESGMTALVGGLAGINMISGAGMIDFLACHSPEKLVIDAEIIGMVKRMLEGMKVLTDPYATGFYDNINFKADFLKQKLTRDLFPKEQYLPSPVIDRDSMRGWQNSGAKDTFQRAKARADELVGKYQRPESARAHETELAGMVSSLAREAGMDTLPELI
ncbi:MAG: Glycine betaine methyltransferase [Anaerolineales bacterium]|nr:Glycine betaine methyltransferase [Anaerolineales bacterium]